MREHGTYACYSFGPDPGAGHGCRCEPCRRAARDYNRSLTGRLEPAYVGAARARSHVTDLTAAGVGLKRIAAVSGVSHGALWKLMYGQNGQPSRRIRRETEQKLLTVTPADVADGSTVDATEAWRIVNRLVDAGVPKAWIAHQIGQQGQGLQLGADRVSPRNLRALVDLEARIDSGETIPVRRDRWGNTHEITVPPRTRPESPDRSFQTLLASLTETIEARSAPWRQRAACRGRTWMFYPARGDGQTAQAAKALCARCPVRQPCAEAGTDEADGIWGGISAGQRRHLRHGTA